MESSERPSGATALRFDDNRVKEQIKRIQEYVWARHVDGSDNYDHSIEEEDAIQTLDSFYSGIGNRNSPDQVRRTRVKSGYFLDEERLRG